MKTFREYINLIENAQRPMTKEAAYTGDYDTDEKHIQHLMKKYHWTRQEAEEHLTSSESDSEQFNESSDTTLQQWTASVKQKFPDARFVQNKTTGEYIAQSTQGRGIVSRWNNGVKESSQKKKSEQVKRHYFKDKTNEQAVSEVDDPQAVHDAGLKLPIASQYMGDGQFKVTVKNKPYIVTVAGFEIDDLNPGILDSFYLTDIATGKTEHVTSAVNNPQAVAIYNNLENSQRPALKEIYKQAFPKA